MRKLVGVGMVLVVVFSAGCGGDTTSPVGPGTEPVTITFLRHDNPTYVTADHAFFEEYHRAHPNVTIADTTVDFHTLADTLLGDLKRDQFTYDLVAIPPSRLCGYAENLRDVPEEVVSLAEAQNTFFLAPLEGSTCKDRYGVDRLKGLPIEYNLEYGGVVINMTKWRARFPGKTPGWADWPSFVADAAALAEYDGPAMKANGLDIDPDWHEPIKHMFLAQILQRNGQYWNADKTAFNFRTPEARAALAAMVDWIRVDRVMSRDLVPDKNTHVTTRLALGATGYGWSDVAKPLSVMGYVGSWGVPSVVAQLPAGSSWEFAFYALPPMVGTEHRFVQNSGWAFAVPRTSKHPGEAWDLARSLALDETAMRAWSKITGALPALRANGTAAAAEGDPTLSQVQPLFEPGHWIGWIPPSAYETVAGAMLNNYFAAVAGTVSIDDALTNMETVCNEALKEHWNE